MRFLLLAVSMFFFFTQPAYAYLDPGTGSMIIQMAIAGILSLSFTIKMYWYKIKMYWYKIKDFFSKDEQNEDSNPDDNESK